MGNKTRRFDASHWRVFHRCQSDVTNFSGYFEIGILAAQVFVSSSIALSSPGTMNAVPDLLAPCGCHPACLTPFLRFRDRFLRKKISQRRFAVDSRLLSLTCQSGNHTACVWLLIEQKHTQTNMSRESISSVTETVLGPNYRPNRVLAWSEDLESAGAKHPLPHCALLNEYHGVPRVAISAT